MDVSSSDQHNHFNDHLDDNKFNYYNDHEQHHYVYDFQYHNHNNTPSMTDCILIGNGTSVMDVRNGTKIDVCPCVARFNAFETKGYEEFVGEKSDVWFTCIPAVREDWRTMIPWSAVHVHTFHERIEDDAVYHSHAQTFGERASKVSHEVLGELRRFSKESAPWSTGIVAIWLMLTKFPSVAITGFDWWERDAHHYCDQAPRGHLHKPDVEHRIILKLQDEGRLSFL